MSASRGHRHLLGSPSRPFFRRRERTRCRSLFLFCPFLRGLGRLGTRPELCKPPSKPFRPRMFRDRLQYSGSLGKRVAMTSAGTGVAVHLDGFTAAGLAAHRALTSAGTDDVELAMVFAGTRHDDDEYKAVLDAVQ